MRYLVLAAALVALPAHAQDADPDGNVALVKRMQIALHLEGFDPGPINGLNEGRTQAALAQFQLSRNLPASGALDDATLDALGVSREAPPEQQAAEGEENASAGSGMPLARP